MTYDMQRSPMNRAPTPRRRAELAAVKASKAVVFQRSEGRCECCGVRLTEAWEFSHRRQSGMGGAKGNARVSNGLASCGPFGCNYKISADADWQQRARDNGWIVHRGADPAALPVLLFGRGWCFLAEDGSVEPVDSAPANVTR